MSSRDSLSYFRKTEIIKGGVNDSRTCRERDCPHYGPFGKVKWRRKSL